MATPHDIMICDNCSRTLGVIFVPNSALFTIACTTCVHVIAEAKGIVPLDSDEKWAQVKAEIGLQNGR